MSRSSQGQGHICQKIASGVSSHKIYNITKDKMIYLIIWTKLKMSVISGDDEKNARIENKST